ncbi:MAG: HEPN domain-containing protein [Anaerolineae bacterium]
MTNRERARSLLAQARDRWRVMHTALQEGSYPFTVRLSQECIELSLKAALYVVGIDPPKWHDVGPALQGNRSRFPAWFAAEIDRYAEISKRWRAEREPSMYGDEARGLPPEKLYGQAQAEKAISEADEIFRACERLIEEGGDKPCPS